GTAIFGGSQRLGIVSFQVAGAAVQPDDEQGCVLSRAVWRRFRATAKQLRPGERSQPGQAKAKELAPTRRTGAGHAQRTSAFHQPFSLSGPAGAARTLTSQSGPGLSSLTR